MWWIGDKYASVLHESTCEAITIFLDSSHTLLLKKQQPKIMTTRLAALGPAPSRSGSNAAFNDKV